MKLETFLENPEAQSLVDALMDISERLRRLEAQFEGLNVLALSIHAEMPIHPQGDSLEVSQ